MFSYRHAFHAGNFADLVKHAGLLRLMVPSGPSTSSAVSTPTVPSEQPANSPKGVARVHIRTR